MWKACSCAGTARGRYRDALRHRDLRLLMSAFLVESLAPTVRSGTFAMTYATGVALLGGTTQVATSAPPIHLLWR